SSHAGRARFCRCLDMSALAYRTPCHTRGIGERDLSSSPGPDILLPQIAFSEVQRLGDPFDCKIDRLPGPDQGWRKDHGVAGCTQHHAVCDGVVANRYRGRTLIREASTAFLVLDDLTRTHQAERTDFAHDGVSLDPLLQSLVEVRPCFVANTFDQTLFFD